MTITEAIKKANTGQGIRRSSWHKDISIVPTNTDKCCLIYEGKKMISSYWNPKKQDLIANNWILA